MSSRYVPPSLRNSSNRASTESGNQPVSTTQPPSESPAGGRKPYNGGRGYRPRGFSSFRQSFSRQGPQRNSQPKVVRGNEFLEYNGKAVYDLKAIKKHFRTMGNAENTQDQSSEVTDNDDAKSEAGEANHESNQTTQHSTLNGTAADPHTLSHVFLFSHANPRWEEDKIIFVKSNLELLPPPESLTKEESTMDGNNDQKQLQKSILVFKQVGIMQGSMFVLDGWYKLANIEIIEPYSDALAKMMKQKWEVKDRFGNPFQRKRDPAAWEASLRHKWAVIKLTEDVEAQQTREPLDIPKLTDFPPLPEPKKPEATKSVNELLQELRLKDSDGDKAA
jgi:hypothetical protein